METNKRIRRLERHMCASFISSCMPDFVYAALEPCGLRAERHTDKSFPQRK